MKKTEVNEPEKSEHNPIRSEKKPEPKFLKVKLSESDNTVDSEGEEKAVKRRMKQEKERRIQHPPDLVVM